MKKRILALLLVCMLGAAPAFAASYTAKVKGGALFTLQYDDRAYALDQYSYLNSVFNGTWFFILYNGQHSVDCGLEHTDRGFGTTLRGASQTVLDEYTSAVCAAANGTAVEIYWVGKQPFVIVSANHPGIGQVYYAETVIGGNAVYFEVYNMSTGAADESGLAALKEVLSGFSALR